MSKSHRADDGHEDLAPLEDEDDRDPIALRSR